MKSQIVLVRRLLIHSVCGMTHVAEDQHPVRPGVRPEHTVVNHEPLVLVRAVPPEEDLHHVPVEHDESGDERHLRHVLEVAHRDEVFEPEHPPQRDGECEDHRKAGVDGAGHEVGREDRRVPPGNDADREVEADDRVHREHQRRRHARKQQVRVLVTLPVARRAAPAERERAIDVFRDLVLGAVTQRRQIRDEPGVPEERGYRSVGADREHVPDERAAELRPDVHAVRVREQPVGGEPRPAGVDKREHQRAGDSEERHRFGEPVDRRAPVLLEEQQNRRDERAGVADADPPHEIDDVERPADRNVVTPDADALEEQVADRDQQHVQEQEGDRRRDHPRDRLVLRQYDRGDFARHRLERMTRLDDRRRRLVGRALDVCRIHQCPVVRSPVFAGSSSGLGLRSDARYVVRGRVLRSSSIP